MIRKIMLSLLILIAATSAVHAEEQNATGSFNTRKANLTEIHALRVGYDEEAVRIVLDVTKPLEFTESYVENPSRMIVDLKNTWLNPSIQREMELKSTTAKRIRIAQFNPSTVRIVIESMSSTKIFNLDGGTTGHRFVIDVGSVELKERRERELKERQERELKERQERELKERQERELKERQERELKERQERELKERQERELKERQERELKERQERELKERQERELKERQERELKERQERELKERQERELKERQERELKERQKRELKEKEKRERELKEKEKRERELKEKEKRERDKYTEVDEPFKPLETNPRESTSPDDKNKIDKDKDKDKVITPSSRTLETDLEQITALSGKVIVLDPGHGGNDAGAIGPTGVMEKNVTLKVALELRKLLEAEGATVIMTRETDTTVSYKGAKATDIEELGARCEVANRAGADIFISIHADSFTRPEARGTTGYYYSKSTTGRGQRLADAIRRNLVEQLGTPSRGTQPCNFYVVRHTDMPATLIELGFISNKDEEKLLDSKEGVKKAAQGILDGIEDYFG